MAWSWSHSQEAYVYARSGLSKLPINTLIEVAAEWKVLLAYREANPSHQWCNDPPYTTDVYLSKLNDARRGVKQYTCDALVEYVWDCMQEAATCDNGGYNAWVDPQGWITMSFSAVPFNRKEN